MEISEKQLKIYINHEGKTPFIKWLEDLRDSRTKQKILARLARLRLGNFGDCSSIGEGVLELRIHYGPGYRVYFGQADSSIVILLLGGDKNTQHEDIKKAKAYWKSYKAEGKNANY